jgi:hypothetical protein
MLDPFDVYQNAVQYISTVLNSFNVFLFNLLYIQVHFAVLMNLISVTALLDFSFAFIVQFCLSDESAGKLGYYNILSCSWTFYGLKIVVIPRSD